MNFDLSGKHMEQKQKGLKMAGGIFSTIVMLFLGVLLSYSTSNAQKAETQSAEIYQQSFARAVSIYDAHIGKNSMLRTGRYYFTDYGGKKGHQFYVDDYWERGSVTYEGEVFDNIFLKYDIYGDIILVEHFNIDGYPSPIQLYRPKVSSFTLMGHHFIWLEKDTISGLRTGFYDQMYKNDGLEVLVKRKKEMVNATEINSVNEEFAVKDRFYIKKNEMIYRVKSNGSIAKVLKDRKKEVKSFIKKNHFIFKINTDNQLVEVVKYYDSLL